MAFISQRPSGSTWNEKARYIEQSTSALARYVAMGDEAARHTKMKEYTPTQAQEADISLYQRLISDEQKTGPGRMPERGAGEPLTTSKTTGWGKEDIAVSGVSHQPEIQAYHHASSRLMLQEHDGHLHHQRLQAIERQRNIQDHNDMIVARKREETRQRKMAQLEKLKEAFAQGIRPKTRGQMMVDKIHANKAAKGIAALSMDPLTDSMSALSMSESTPNRSIITQNPSAKKRRSGKKTERSLSKNKGKSQGKGINRTLGF